MADFNNLPAFLAKLTPALSAAVSQSADSIADSARAVVAVDTGALKASIESKTTGALEAEVTAGGGEVDYAGFIEFGTSRAGAQPFMYPSAQAGEQPFIQRVKDAVQP